MLVEHLLYARHSDQHVMNMFSLKPSHCFMRHCYYLSSTYRKGVEVQTPERNLSQGYSKLATDLKSNLRLYSRALITLSQGSKNPVYSPVKGGSLMTSPHSHTRSHTHKHAVTHTLTLTHTHNTLTHIHSHILTHTTHTHTHTHTHPIPCGRRNP